MSFYIYIFHPLESASAGRQRKVVAEDVEYNKKEDQADCHADTEYKGLSSQQIVRQAS